MSTRHIPYPSDFDVNHDAAREEERRRRALHTLDVSHILSVIDDLISQEPDPKHHPCYDLVNWLLDRQLAVHGGELWDAWKRLAVAAIDQALASRLDEEG
jgi:hypothetical protein